MARKVEYDFLNYTSFPSSMKIFNDTDRRGPWELLTINLPITSGANISADIKIKEENAHADPTGIWGLTLYTSPEPAPRPVGGQPTPWKYFNTTHTPLGTHDWVDRSLSKVKVVPVDHRFMLIAIYGSAGSPETPCISWFDDLKVYQDDMLIYENKFTAPIAKGAVMAALSIITGLGVVRFGKKG